MLREAHTNADSQKISLNNEAYHPPAALSVCAFAKAVGVSRTFVYELIASGDVRSVKIRDRRIIPVTEINRLLETAA